MTNDIEFYGDSISGNCYKLQLACAELGIDYVWHEIDIMAGATRTEEFLAMNPNGKVPLMRLADGRCVPESNAILSYLANDAFSIADIALYAYTHVAFEGGFDLQPYTAVSKWLQCIEDRPQYVPMRAASDGHQ